jgi:hypothetical protein
VLLNSHTNHHDKRQRRDDTANGMTLSCQTEDKGRGAKNIAKEGGKQRMNDKVGEEISCIFFIFKRNGDCDNTFRCLLTQK